MSRTTMLTLLLILLCAAAAQAATVTLMAPRPATTPPAASPAPVSIYLDGKLLEATGIMRDGVVYVPLRAFSQKLQLDLRWDAKARLVHLSRPVSSSTPVREAAASARPAAPTLVPMPIKLNPSAAAPVVPAGPPPELVAYAEAARKAMEPLREVQSLLRVGLGYDEYRGRIGQARIAVDRFLRDQPADLAPPSRTRLGDAMDAYQVAVAMWSGQVDCEARRKATDSETIGKMWADCEAQFKRGAQDRWKAAESMVGETESALTRTLEKASPAAHGK